MWCRICGQDVPGVPSLEEGNYSCARCAQPLAPISHEWAAASARPAPAGTETAGVASTAAQRPPIYDGWEIDEQLRHVGRVLGPDLFPWEESDKPSAQRAFRLDAGHDVPAPHRKQARGSRKKSKRVAPTAKKHAPGDRLLAFLAWTALWLGTMGSACGLALLVRSMNTGRQELWTVGGPILLAGQIALVLGLVLQLDRFWRDNRWAAAKKRTVGEQSHDRKTVTDLPGATHASSSELSAHWSSGASPEVLLSDLKSQLDLLSAKLTEQ